MNVIRKLWIKIAIGVAVLSAVTLFVSSLFLPPWDTVQQIIFNAIVASMFISGVAAILGYPLMRQMDIYIAKTLEENACDNRVWQTNVSHIGLWRELTTVIARIHEKRDVRESKLNANLRDAETKQHVAEAEREHLEGVLNTLKDGVIVTDAYNEIILANPAVGQMLQFDPVASISTNISDVSKDPAIPKLIIDTQQSGNLAARRLIQHDLEDPMNNDQRTLEISLSCVPSHTNQSGGVVAILHDITKEREISEMKTDFVSKASHELRTPLSSIKAYIEMLIDGEANEEDAKQEFYQIIQTESNRLGRLIDNLLDISRIEAGLMQIDLEETSLDNIIEEVVDIAKPQAISKTINLIYKGSQLCTNAEVDRDLIQQVIMNLTSNAIKYTPDGGRVTVTTSMTDCDRSVLVTISDTGLGIPPDALPHLFEKFYRIKNYKTVAKGSGLGLNLVKHIVETVHHGEVGVDSELGMGSKFWFSVPCRKVA